MVFSAQQTKFEFLSHLKEFGSRPAEWQIGVAADAEAALFADNRVDRMQDIWVWKPMLSAAAARIVFDYFAGRHGMPAAHSHSGPDARQVFMFRKAGS